MERVAERGRKYAAAGRKSVGRNTRKSKKRRRFRKVILGIWFYFEVAGIIATCYLLLSLLFGGKVNASSAVIKDVRESLEETGGFWESGEADGSVFQTTVTPETRRKCQELYAAHQELLILVNKEQALPADYQAGLRRICQGRLEAADILYEDLCDMLNAAGLEGYEYWIASAYRSREYQQGLVDEDVAAYAAKGLSYEKALQKTYEYTMPAGYSEHETGLALDILCSTNTKMDESQKDEPGNRWLARHCQEYGFILRYPEDKEDVTKINYEPWHFRYVGKEAAEFLTNNGWTLEEFYEAMGG